MDKADIKQFHGFDWDQGNQGKNWEKHGVSRIECEQIFFNDPLFLADDHKHSKQETRYFALGKTELQRLLFLVFTERKGLIRVISARDMSKKERAFYENL